MKHFYLGPKSIDLNEKTLRKDFMYKYFYVNTKFMLQDTIYILVYHPREKISILELFIVIMKK